MFVLDLMAWCWQHDAEKRPPSLHISLLASATEFPRLSDVITFDKQVSLTTTTFLVLSLTRTYILQRQKIIFKKQYWLPEINVGAR